MLMIKLHTIPFGIAGPPLIYSRARKEVKEASLSLLRVREKSAGQPKDGGYRRRGGTLILSREQSLRHRQEKKRKEKYIISNNLLF
jgi:hypothetical protein